MTRARGGPARRRKRVRLHKLAKGYRGARGRLVRRTRDAVARGMTYATRDRKVRKRSFRRLWTVRINAGARAHGLTYGELINGLKKANVVIDRKVLAHLAMSDDIAFGELVALAKREVEASR